MDHPDVPALAGPHVPKSNQAGRTALGGDRSRQRRTLGGWSRRLQGMERKSLQARIEDIHSWLTERQPISRPHRLCPSPGSTARTPKIGSSRRQLAAVFIGFGLAIGLCGALLGLGLGVWITENIREIELGLSKLFGFKIWKSSSYQFMIPNQITWRSVSWIPLAGVALAILGALLPAIRAARLQPAESLRHE